jgi:hypothetical protein
MLSICWVLMVGWLVILVLALVGICRIKNPSYLKIGAGRRFYLEVGQGLLSGHRARQAEIPQGSQRCG